MSHGLRRRLLKLWREWLRSVVLIVIIISSFRSAVADWNDVPTGSMKPSILEGDRIVVNKLAYGLRVPFTTWRLASWGAPNRGDIVVLYSPSDGKRLVKRVIGLPGDILEMKDNRLIVNGSFVAYSPLVDDLPGADLDSAGGRQLAMERLKDRTHPVMITPSRVSRRSFGPILVPQGRYFVMGDNRDESMDSRHFGFVEGTQIVGRATAVAASVDPEHHYRPRWQRFFHSLH